MTIFTGSELISEKYASVIKSNRKGGYDPELLYVECRNCGRPIIWEPGKTTALLAEADIKPGEVSPECLLLAETCPTCKPEIQAVKVQVVRLGELDISSVGDEVLFMPGCAGNA